MIPDKNTEEMTENRECVRISVRALVEFLLRSGDIDDRIGGALEKDAMQLGSRLHRKIQRRMGAGYSAEEALSCTLPCADFMLRVEGRADGIIREKEKKYTIDEIKGVMRSLERISESVPVHLAQAKCYAYMFALRESLDEIGVQMTYVSLQTEEVKYFRYSFSFEELESWFLELVDEYRKWAVFQRDWRKIRQASIHETTFPFPYREGQKELAGQVYRSIAREKILFIQAPTGTGKTLSTLFPAVKAMGEGLGERIFYLTARTITRLAALEAFDQLCGRGLKCKRVILTAKEKICKCESVECNPVSCPYAKGHYDRINDAVYRMITTQDCFTREVISEAADRYMVCPFELSLDLSLWMDAVIGDYNYAFHPRSRLKRFFGEGVSGDYLFLIDEAHNLADRGRDMFSAALYKEDFLALKKEVKTSFPGLAKALEKANRAMLALKRECETWKVLDETGTLPAALINLYAVMEELLQVRPDAQEEDRRRVPPLDHELRKKVLEMYFEVSTFLDTLDRLDEHYMTYSEQLEGGRFMVCLFNVNPAANLQEVMDKARSCILFSATLLPIDYYREVLSTRTDNYAVYARTVFSPDQLRVMIGTDTSSRFVRRSPALYRTLAAYIIQTVNAHAGNYMVFFPSYKMLSQVEEILLQETSGSKVEILSQHSGMREEEREDFLLQFSEERKGSLVGLCVMGSIFGEGIDLKRDRLIGAIVIGPGLPMVCTRQEILRMYYEKNGRDGFYFAYQCPGMSRVLQAAGRVIRTEEDRGIVLLLDERFTEGRYQKMFPREWQEVGYVTLPQVTGRLQAFWEE